MVVTVRFPVHAPLSLRLKGNLCVSAFSFLDRLSGAPPSRPKNIPLSDESKNEHAWFVNSCRSNIWMGFHSEPCPSTFTGQHRVKPGHVNLYISSLKDLAQRRGNLVYLVPPDPGHLVSAIIPILEENLPPSTNSENLSGWNLRRWNSISRSIPIRCSLSALQE